MLGKNTGDYTIFYNTSFKKKIIIAKMTLMMVDYSRPPRPVEENEANCSQGRAQLAKKEITKDKAVLLIETGLRRWQESLNRRRFNNRTIKRGRITMKVDRRRNHWVVSPCKRSCLRPSPCFESKCCRIFPI